MNVIVNDPYTNESREIVIPLGRSIIIIDPFLVNLDDLQNAQEGKDVLVRVRRPGWGKPEAMNAIRLIELPQE